VSVAETSPAAIEEEFHRLTSDPDVAVLIINQYVRCHTPLFCLSEVAILGTLPRGALLAVQYALLTFD